nr:MAG TPA: hypothetical protein [Caudoviricetes sp.]
MLVVVPYRRLYLMTMNAVMVQDTEVHQAIINVPYIVIHTKHQRLH